MSVISPYFTSYYLFSGFVILNGLSEVIKPILQLKPTWLLCNINPEGENLRLAKSDQGDKHAEELLLEELRDLKIKDETLTITIFMNDTPCSLDRHMCAKNFIQYIKTKKKVDLTLYVTNLSENRSEICFMEDRDSHSDCEIQDETAHKDGLKELMKYCTVECPSEKAWNELFEIMNVCEKEEAIKKFWEDYEKKIYDKTRKYEDERINSYLGPLNIDN